METQVQHRNGTAGQPKRPLDDILDDLKRPIKARHLKTKPRDGQELTFCPWYKTLQYLDFYTNGHWSKHVEIDHTAERVFVTCELTIYAQEGPVTRTATGTESLDVDSYGDPSSNAESMAFRRACANFGLGLHLYE